MDIQIDTREKERAIRKVLAEFNRKNINYISNKLVCGDYMNLDNARLIIDRKQNLSEVYANLCPNKTNPKKNGRLRIERELERAGKMGIKIIFLVEHGKGIKELEDVQNWHNPRLDKTPYAWDGFRLYREMLKMKSRYGTEWLFCDKDETGKRIIELLGGVQDENS